MAHWVRDVSVGALTWCWYWLAPAYQLKRMKKRRLSRGSWEVDHIGMTLGWSLVVKGWSCTRGSVLQNAQGSGLRRDYKSDNTVLVI